MNYNEIKKTLSNYKPYILESKKYLMSAVLIPIVEINNELHLIYETRASKLRSQPLDVSFPGGKIDKTDFNPLQTAIRETTEELGISKDDIEIICELDILVAPYGVIIHNFVGKINDISKININKDEVDSIFTIPISFLKNNKPISYKCAVTLSRNEDFPFHLIPFGKDYPFKSGYYETLFWHYNGKTVWGMTASITNNFIEQI